MTRALDEKLARLHASPGRCDDFVLADAKDADLAFGLAAPGAGRSLADFRDQIREIVAQGLVDVMLMSLATSELLTVNERLFEGSSVTPAVRANDTSDIHALAGARYPAQPSRPFATPTVEELRRAGGADLALYSMTPANDAAVDVPALEAYRTFRHEAGSHGVRHFLELFAPNVAATAPADPGRFLADFVARTLAGVPEAGRPVFLKLPYTGARTMRELVEYDPHLVPGIMGGAAGTTYDAFFLLEDARRAGARAALFGRKIKDSEHPLAFVRHLRLIADGALGADEACRSYHDELRSLGVAPHRPLADDLRLTAASAAFAG